MASIFSEHDQGETGSLYTEALRAAVEEMGHAPSEAQLEALLAEFDFDRSGQG